MKYYVKDLVECSIMTFYGKHIDEYVRINCNRPRNKIERYFLNLRLSKKYEQVSARIHELVKNKLKDGGNHCAIAEVINTAMVDMLDIKKVDIQRGRS